MRNKISHRIVCIGKSRPAKKNVSQRPSIRSPRAGGYRTVIIKDGEFVQRRSGG